MPSDPGAQIFFSHSNSWKSDGGVSVWPGRRGSIFQHWVQASGHGERAKGTRITQYQGNPLPSPSCSRRAALGGRECEPASVAVEDGAVEGSTNKARTCIGPAKVQGSQKFPGCSKVGGSLLLGACLVQGPADLTKMKRATFNSHLFFPMIKRARPWRLAFNESGVRCEDLSRWCR